MHLNCFTVTGDLTKMKDASFTIAEGCFYQLRISFYVQREIVTGLKYLQQSYRAGIRGTLYEALCICNGEPGTGSIICKTYVVFCCRLWNF